MNRNRISPVENVERPSDQVGLIRKDRLSAAFFGRCVEILCGRCSYPSGPKLSIAWRWNVEMQSAHHLSTRWLVTGYGLSLISFAIMALFMIDALNVTPSIAGSVQLGYNSNTTYLFKIGYWYEFWIAIVALVAGAVLAAVTYYRYK